MAHYFVNKNCGLSPYDPDYDDTYDAEEAYDEYEWEMELREDIAREERFC